MQSPHPERTLRKTSALPDKPSPAARSSPSNEDTVDLCNTVTMTPLCARLLSGVPNTARVADRSNFCEKLTREPHRGSTRQAFAGSLYIERRIGNDRLGVAETYLEVAPRVRRLGLGCSKEGEPDRTPRRGERNSSMKEIRP
jgi:hypothetical protein